MRLQSLTMMSVIAATAAIGLIAAPQSNQAAERTFAQELARGNMAEIELGNMAQQKASNAAVKDFATRMVNDHTELNNELKTWAQQNNVSLPASVSPAEAAQKKNLEGKSGQAFDTAYMDYMLSDHQHDVKTVQHMAETAQDQNVKQLAEKCLPTLENHLRIAENVAGKLGMSSSKGLNQPVHPNGTANRK